MSLFRKKKTSVPVIPAGDREPVLRCSICTGEQVLCLQDRKTGSLSELMRINSPADLEDFCKVNGLTPEEIRKVY